MPVEADSEHHQIEAVADRRVVVHAVLRNVGIVRIEKVKGGRRQIGRRQSIDAAAYAGCGPDRPGQVRRTRPARTRSRARTRRVRRGRCATSRHRCLPASCPKAGRSSNPASCAADPATTNRRCRSTRTSESNRRRFIRPSHKSIGLETVGGRKGQRDLLADPCRVVRRVQHLEHDAPILAGRDRRRVVSYALDEVLQLLRISLIERFLEIGEGPALVSSRLSPSRSHSPFRCRSTRNSP